MEKIMKKILVVEDDITLNSFLCFQLDMAGYLPISSYRCEKAKKLMETNIFTLAVLDVNLPDGSGFELYRELKKQQSKLPAIFLTGNGQEQDILEGLELGAEDYITKPFSIKILLKKIEMILKRLDSTENQKKIKKEEYTNYYSDGFLTLNLEELTAGCDGNTLFLTATEYKILRLLIVNTGRVVTRQKLLSIWDNEGNYIDDHTLTVTMTRLRSKLEKNDHSYIKTIRGMGYLWNGKDEK